MFADDVVRDGNGKITSTITNTVTGQIVRDANGKIIERRDKQSDGTIIVRDPNGNIIRREEHRK